MSGEVVDFRAALADRSYTVQAHLRSPQFLHLRANGLWPMPQGPHAKKRKPQFGHFIAVARLQTTNQMTA
ncbi:MAG TPA: hypothetical protein VKV02_00090 [Acidobacteriaceae bacterium]|nr:hypothetical protein [Acidobacteriaceae bacterium]